MSVPIRLLVYVAHLDVEKSVCIECPSLHLEQSGNAECTAYNSPAEFKADPFPGECARSSIPFDEPLPALPQAPALSQAHKAEGQGTPILQKVKIDSLDRARIRSFLQSRLDGLPDFFHHDRRHRFFNQFQRGLFRLQSFNRIKRVSVLQSFNDDRNCSPALAQAR